MPSRAYNSGMEMTPAHRELSTNQTAKFTALVHAADELYRNGESSKITAQHRAALRFLSRKIPWIRQPKEQK